MGEQKDRLDHTVVTSLLVTDLVNSTRLVEQLGDVRAAEIFSRQDRLTRDLAQAQGGQEITRPTAFCCCLVVQSTLSPSPQECQNTTESQKR